MPHFFTEGNTFSASRSGRAAATSVETMANQIPFIKMEGAANDYVFFDLRETSAALAAPFSPAEIRAISDRRTGVGGDGVVVIAPSERALARMVMFNADGSSSAMCGNALRCIALHVHEQTGASEFTLESSVGLHRARVLARDPAWIEIEMPAPRFAAADIPFDPARAGAAPAQPAGPHGAMLDAPIRASLPDGEREVRAALVSMGNPHCVLFVDDADNADFEQLGPALETHPAFPERANIEFVSVDRASGGLYQRTYERGSGETLACGSGACAVHVAAALTGRSGAVSRIRLRGGTLELEWDPTRLPAAPVLMRGPARVAFRGAVDRDALAGDRRP